MSADLQSMRKKLKTQNGSHRMIKDPRKELSKYLNATQNASKPCRYAYYDLTKDVQRNAGDEINWASIDRQNYKKAKTTSSQSGKRVTANEHTKVSKIDIKLVDTKVNEIAHKLTNCVIWVYGPMSC